MNTYLNAKDLYANTEQGEDWAVDVSFRNSPVLVMAIHGGIEPATSYIADAVAKAGGFNYFAFRSLRHPMESRDLHVSSSAFTHPALEQLIDTSLVSVSFHSMARWTDEILVGGRNYKLGDEIRSVMRMMGYDACSAYFQRSKKTNTPLDGMNRANVVNRTRLDGVQLECGINFGDRFFSTGSALDPLIDRLELQKFSSLMVATIEFYIKQEIQSQVGTNELDCAA